MHDLSLGGTVVGVSADRRHRFSKVPRREILLIEGHGVDGDAHAGPFIRHRYLARRQPRLPNLRQVHLMPCELFESLRSCGYEVQAGDLGENITTAGLDLERMPFGTRIQFGATAVVELTGLRTPCMLIDRFRAGLKRHILSLTQSGVSSERSGPAFKSGVLGVVRAGGSVAAGDRARVLLPVSTFQILPPL